MTHNAKSLQASSCSGGFKFAMLACSSILMKEKNQLMSFLRQLPKLPKAIVPPQSLAGFCVLERSRIHN